MANTQSMERPGALGQLPSLKTALAVITGVMMLIDLYLILLDKPSYGRHLRDTGNGAQFISQIPILYAP